MALGLLQIHQVPEPWESCSLCYLKGPCACERDSSVHCCFANGTHFLQCCSLKQRHPATSLLRWECRNHETGTLCSHYSCWCLQPGLWPPKCPHVHHVHYVNTAVEKMRRGGHGHDSTSSHQATTALHHGGEDVGAVASWP